MSVWLGAIHFTPSCDALAFVIVGSADTPVSELSAAYFGHAYCVAAVGVGVGVGIGVGVGVAAGVVPDATGNVALAVSKVASAANEAKVP
jgi:hypothetical protein